MADDKKGLDLKNPGGKEILIAGGVAVVLGVVYLKLNANKAAASAGGGAPDVPASGHGLGGVPGAQLQTFFPGGSSAAGNALTDSLFTTPATPSPGQGSVTIPTITGVNDQAGGGIGGRVPGPRIGQVDTPVRHAQQGADSVLGGGNLSVPGAVPGNIPATPATGLTGQWQGSSLFSSPVSPVAWADSVLRALKAPFTNANRQSLIAWALNEGGGGSYNPLNTTMGPGSNFNSVGVKNFPNWNVGAAETAATIENGRYPNILAGLQSGKGIGSNATQDLMTWSGSGYGAISGTWARAGAIIAAYVKAAQSKQARLLSSPAAKGTPAPVRRKFGPRARPAVRRPILSIPRINYAALANLLPRRPAPKPLTQAPHHQRFVGGY